MSPATPRWSGNIKNEGGQPMIWVFEMQFYLKEGCIMSMLYQSYVVSQYIRYT